MCSVSQEVCIKWQPNDAHHQSPTGARSKTGGSIAIQGRPVCRAPCERRWVWQRRTCLMRPVAAALGSPCVSLPSLMSSLSRLAVPLVFDLLSLICPIRACAPVSVYPWVPSGKKQLWRAVDYQSHAAKRRTRGARLCSSIFPPSAARESHSPPSHLRFSYPTPPSSRKESDDARDDLTTHPKRWVSLTWVSLWPLTWPWRLGCPRASGCPGQLCIQPTPTPRMSGARPTSWPEPTAPVPSGWHRQLATGSAPGGGERGGAAKKPRRP